MKEENQEYKPKNLLQKAILSTKDQKEMIMKDEIEDY